MPIDRLRTESPLGVTGAVLKRKAVRAFKADVVDIQVVRDILATAGRSPSGGNLQPWIVHVVVGKTLSVLKLRLSERLERETPDASEYEIYPRGLWEPHRTWRRNAGSGRYAALGFEEKSDEGRLDLLRRNYAFFDAPVGLFFCIDRRMGPPQWADLGMFMQTVMLLAVERGLDTCPQEIWANASDTVGEVLDIPPATMLFAGMALGYRDEAAPLAAVETERANADQYIFTHA